MISLIAALGKNRELGLNNQMLWHVKEDFKHFKETTMGHTLLMGRKTFESIGRPLPGRKTFILTRNSDYQIENCSTIHSLQEGVERANQNKEQELFIAGGAEIYRQALESLPIEKMYLSYMDFEGEADAFFPKFDSSEWTVTCEEKFPATDKSMAWTLKILEKV